MTVQYSTIQYHALQENTIQYNTFRHNAVQYNKIFKIKQDNTKWIGTQQMKNPLDTNGLYHIPVQYSHSPQISQAC